jgi:outer membrane protein assembly factor BamB
VEGVVDKSSGKTYYVHRQTKETTWNRPAELGAQPGVPGVDGGDSEWKEVIDKNSGRPYYVHRQTKETRWDRPADLSPALESATTQLDALDALDALEVEAVETVEIDLGADIETPDDV